MFAFDEDTAVTQIADDTWKGRLDPKWSINVVPNGGYSTALMIRALLERTNRPDPLSVTTHFQRATVQDAEVRIETDLVRSGRTAAHAAATLIQDGEVRSRCVAVLGALPHPSADDVMPPPVTLPPPEQCIERDPGYQGFPIPLGDMVEMRLDREPGGHAEARYGAWLRFRDDRPNDVLSLGLFVDSLPPSVLMTHDRIGWVPTLELTAHVRRRPAPGWIRAEIAAADVQGNVLIEDVRLWDETDALVAQARQLAMLRT